MNDIDLLQRYVREGSQDAFGQIVTRHVDLVYSAARRILPESHFAEDVTQQVFVLLARKAKKLRADTILSAWLYRTARNLASETLRREQRRQRRERLAAEAMSDSDADTAWKLIEPLLDDAMARLRSADHDAIVLRYFENKSLKEVGKLLGWSEDAAQKRVARALHRLNANLRRSGATVSLSALGATVTIGAVQSAPAGLGLSAASASVLAAGNTSLASQSILYMATAKLKTLGTAAAFCVLSVALVMIWRENAALRRQVESLGSASAESELRSDVDNRPNEARISKEDLRRMQVEHLELLSLRGRVRQLARELRQQQNGNTAQAHAANDRESQGADSLVFTAALTNTVGNGQTLVIGGWGKEGMRGYLLATPVVQLEDAGADGSRLVVQSRVIGAPEAFWEQIGWGAYKSDVRRSALAGVLSPENVSALLQVLNVTAGGEVSNISSVTNRPGDPIGFTYSVDDDQGAGILIGIELYGRITSEGEAVDLELRPSAVSPDKAHSILTRYK